MFSILPRKITVKELEPLLDQEGRELTDDVGNKICTVREVSMWLFLWFKF